MKINSPIDLFTLELQDMYSAETQILEALPKMAAAASEKELQAGFALHLKQTKEHVKRLEQVSKILDVSLEGKPCEGMKGLLKEGAEVMKLQGEPLMMDAALISAARRVEHYEMAGYMSLILLAKQLKENEVKDLLKTTLDEEKETEKLLEGVARSQDPSDLIAQVMEKGKKMLKN